MASVKELKQELKRWKKRAENALGELEALRSEPKGDEGEQDKGGKGGLQEKKSKKERKDKKGKKEKKEKKGKNRKEGKQAPVASEAKSQVDLHSIPIGGSITDQREAWKRHSYLRDRYEFHLAEGKGRPESRRLANRDLEGEYGASFGFTEEQLDAILT